jgi:TRAP transporter TAXI family solute receptor
MIQPTKNNLRAAKIFGGGNMARRLMALAPVVFACISFLTFPAAHAEDVKLPPTMTFTAYDTGTAGFNIAVAVGKMLKDKYGTDLRVLPAGNDVARLAPLRAGRAQSSAMGSGTYFAQEGVFEFGVKEWGPQALQLVLSSVDCNAASLGVARDTGVTEIKQLKGKRVGFVVGSPALNQNSLAILAFGDLKQTDVKVVEFSSYGAMWKGLINNDTDAAFATTITGPAKEAETSPRGLIWPPLPHNENTGWERVQKVGSFFFRHVATCGAGISKEKPIELGNYPYPIFVVYGSQPVDQVYAITKAMIVSYDAYKDNAPGAGGLAADRQTKKWVVPVHPGAVKALKEAGQWSDDQEAHNNALFKRQAVLTAAWVDYGKSSPPSDEAAFLSGWMSARAAALAKANMPNGFE